MATIRIGSWLLDADAEATRVVYAQIDRSFVQPDCCVQCKNYLAARNFAYPLEALEIFEVLGIDPTKEPEVYGGYPRPSGLCIYFGWLHFVGTIIEAPEDQDQLEKESWASPRGTVQLTPAFAYYFSKRLTLVPKPMADKKLVQIEFKTEIPWIVEEPNPHLSR